MFLGIWLALLGVLAASNLIIAKKPDAAQLIGKVAPYQGWIGAVSAVCGVFGILGCVSHVGWMGSAPIFWLSRLAVSVLLTCLGLLLGIGVFKSFIENAQAQREPGSGHRQAGSLPGQARCGRDRPRRAG